MGPKPRAPPCFEHVAKPEATVVGRQRHPKAPGRCLVAFDILTSRFPRSAVRGPYKALASNLSIALDSSGNCLICHLANCRSTCDCSANGSFQRSMKTAPEIPLHLSSLSRFRGFGHLPKVWTFLSPSPLSPLFQFQFSFSSQKLPSFSPKFVLFSPALRGSGPRRHSAGSRALSEELARRCSASWRSASTPAPKASEKNTETEKRWKREGKETEMAKQEEMQPAKGRFP